MTKQIIRRFQVDGTFKGDKLVQTRETQRKNLLAMMKDIGFAPLLDVDPVWEQAWIKDDVFSFTYTWQAVYVGKEVAWQTEGVSAGKRIPCTQKPK